MTGPRMETEPGIFSDCPDNVVPFARPRTLPLSEKQELVWRFIASCERSPTYREMADALGFGSTSQLDSIVRGLKAKGYVTYVPGRARSLIATDPVRDLTHFSTAELASELARRLAE